MAEQQREQDNRTTQGAWPRGGRDPRTQPDSGPALPSTIDWKGQERRLSDLTAGELIEAAEVIGKEIAAHRRVTQRKNGDQEMRALHEIALALKLRLQRAIREEFERRIIAPDSPLLVE